MRLPNNANGSSLDRLTGTLQEVINYLRELEIQRNKEYQSVSSVVRATSDTTINEGSYQWNANTDSATITITLPPGSAGQQFKIVNTGISGNSLTITPNGSDKLIGVNSNFSLSDGESLVIAWDDVDGWY